MRAIIENLNLFAKTKKLMETDFVSNGYDFEIVFSNDKMKLIFNQYRGEQTTFIYFCHNNLKRDMYALDVVGKMITDERLILEDFFEQIRYFNENESLIEQAFADADFDEKYNVQFRKLFF